MKRWAIGSVAAFGLGMGLVSLAADFNGDGTGDIAIFRASSGLWAVRGVTRVYFGGSEDNPVPGDYNGNGKDAVAIFRPSSGVWAIRGVTRVYFGGSTDTAMSGDYNGDGNYDFGIFRASSGLWAAKGVTRVYFGRSMDTAISPGKARTPGGGGGVLLKTGQTTSYRTGDDGYYQRGKSFNYTDNGDGTVTDNVTGLMWAKDGEGTGCANGTKKTWNEAIDWAEGLNFAGYTDWRLPNRRELHSLINSGTIVPAINTSYFPNTDFNVYYWSSTSVCDDPSELAWYVDFGGGHMYCTDTTSNLCVRAVRGGK